MDQLHAADQLAQIETKAKVQGEAEGAARRLPGVPAEGAVPGTVGAATPGPPPDCGLRGLMDSPAILGLLRQACRHAMLHVCCTSGYCTQNNGDSLYSPVYLVALFSADLLIKTVNG